MREWLVAGGVIEHLDDVLLVCNRRRNGGLDWSPPGGVIDRGETVIEGLTREVQEETGLVVTSWAGPIYEIRVRFADMSTELRVESYLASEWKGALAIDDPDGIVIDACFAGRADCAAKLAQSPRWVREPLIDWLSARPGRPPSFDYLAEGTDHYSLTVSRL